MAGSSENAKSVYDFTVKDTFGNDVPLENYRGKVLLIVNIASQCGLTKNNYEKLTQLKKDYYDRGKSITRNSARIEYIFFISKRRTEFVHYDYDMNN